MGYNARRVWLAVLGRFGERMGVRGLKPAEFSVLLLVSHNPGITSRQLCASLDILPPNLVRMVHMLQERGLVERRAHPRDGRAVGLHAPPAGLALTREAVRVARQVEADVTGSLTQAERATLSRLLRKVAGPNPGR
ncbi:MAG: winged helix-turn-helix transcriptional regulator [Burkholderiales bacterium]|nr:winged helix-turn-helix transcriptional regulator [Burkholderiales bacterium]